MRPSDLPGLLAFLPSEFPHAVIGVGDASTGLIRVHFVEPVSVRVLDETAAILSDWIPLGLVLVVSCRR